MYIKKEYSPARYCHLYRVVRQSFNYIKFEHEREQKKEKIEFLRKLGIEKILECQRHTHLPQCSFETIGKAAKTVLGEVLDYLVFYRREFENDVAVGRIDKVCIGRQEEFDFRGSIYVGGKFLGDERRTREDAKWDFLVRMRGK